MSSVALLLLLLLSSGELIKPASRQSSAFLSYCLLEPSHPMFLSLLLGLPWHKAAKKPQTKMALKLRASWDASERSVPSLHVPMHTHEYLCTSFKVLYLLRLLFSCVGREQTSAFSVQSCFLTFQLLTNLSKQRKSALDTWQLWWNQK